MRLAFSLLISFIALVSVLAGGTVAMAGPATPAAVEPEPDTARKDAPPKDAPAKETPAKDTPSKDAPAKTDAALDGSSPEATAGSKPDAAPDGSSPSEPPEVAPVEDPLRRRAQQIRALMDGTLDLDVEPSSLFVVDLHDEDLVGPAGERLVALLRDLDAPPPAPPPRTGRRKPRGKPPPPAPPPDPATELASALRDYLRLSPAERQALVLAHARRRDEATALAEATERREARRVMVERRAEQLEAFLDGTLDVDLDPRPLLMMDLGDELESALVPVHRRAWAESESGSEPDETPDEKPGEKPDEKSPDGTAGDTPSDGAVAEPTPEPDGLEQAQARLDAVRRRFLALSAPERDALFDLHESRKTEAEEAAARAKAEAEAEAKAAEEAEQQTAGLDVEAVAEISSAEAEAQAAAQAEKKARAEAREARTEATRILAEERARLQSVKKEQAQLRAEFNRRKAERIANHERALEWRGRVTQLVDGELFGAEREREADGMYDGIRAELHTTRERLRQELRRIQDPGASIPKAGDRLDGDLAADIDRGPIDELRAELSDNEQELLALEQEVSWELAQGLRDDVVLLNRSRLLLLGMASPQLYGEVTGFGDRGFEQVQREFDQISVELGFHALKLPRYKDILLDLLRGSPFTVAWGVVQLLLVMLGLWWWRRRWPKNLRWLRHLLVRRRPVPRWAMMSLTGLWYVDRIRRPLELLLALRIVLSLAGDLDQFPELVLLWIIVRWILIGLAVILWLDAIAVRNTSRRRRKSASDTSALRIHSLRVVGLNVIAVGLLLSLAAAMVGRGAIHSWVISSCWLLSVPVALYLVVRWRPIINERLEQDPDPGAFVTWAREQEGTVMRFVAATAAAAYLLGEGLGQWFMRHLAGLETTRHVLAYLFRQKVVKQAAATAAARQTFEPIEASCYQTFDPEFFERHPIEPIAKTQLDTVATLVNEPRSTLTAVIGERGMGKTSFLRRLEKRLGPERLTVVSCPDAGLAGLMARIAALTGDQDQELSVVAKDLRQMGPLTIAIDDAQRLIQPAVRGLRELDEFTAFARQVGGEISWVICMSSSAWHYLKRARGNRVFFEQIVKLPRWTEEQLGELIRTRCVEAKIEPSFEGLVVPRTAEADPLASPTEQRTEVGYYRLLWDFSRGNPAVALHAFRESLFVGQDDKTIVRLFKEPPAKEIEGLSLPLLFVLRAVVQLDVASESELTAATQLPAADVSDALRFCLTRRYVERYDIGVRITWHWYRTITNVLQRQHLLPKPQA